MKNFENNSIPFFWQDSVRDSSQDTPLQTWQRGVLYEHRAKFFLHLENVEKALSACADAIFYKRRTLRYSLDNPNQNRRIFSLIRTVLMAALIAKHSSRISRARNYFFQAISLVENMEQNDLYEQYATQIHAQIQQMLRKIEKQKEAKEAKKTKEVGEVGEVGETGNQEYP